MASCEVLTFRSRWTSSHRLNEPHDDPLRAKEGRLVEQSSSGSVIGNGGATHPVVAERSPDHALQYNSCWPVFELPEMCPVFMIAGDVIGNESLQTWLVRSTNVVEQLAAAASHPTLGHAVLPGALDRGLRAVHLHGSNRSRGLPIHTSHRDRIPGAWEPHRRRMLPVAAGQSTCSLDAD